VEPAEVAETEKSEDTASKPAPAKPKPKPDADNYCGMRKGFLL